MKISFRVVPAALAAALAAPLSAQTIRGRVVDARTGEAVAEASIAAVTREGRGAGQARTGADGKFTLPLRAAGEMRLRVERTGYRATLSDTRLVAARETLDVDVSISTAPLTLAPLRVNARVAPLRRRSLEMSGVYDRERAGFGQRLFREDLDRQSNMNLGQVLARVNGTTRMQNGPFEYIVFSRSMPNGTREKAAGRYCLPTLFIDGTLAAYGGSADINSLVTPGQIEAVELYSSAANIPLQYNGPNSGCGVILIWTRQEP
jgi:outer membrane receptor for Fe3+-dicitrate